MDKVEVLSPAAIAAIISLFAAVITTIITQYILRANLNKSTKENYRKIYFEKQFVAYQKLWSCFRPISTFYSEKTIINYIENQPHLNLTNAKAFCETITDFFFSQDGILISRDSRFKMFDLRNFLEKIYRGQNQTVLKLSTEQKKEINKQVNELFATVRKDIGSMNLKFDIKDLGVADENKS